MYSSRFRSIRLGRTGNAIVRPTEWIVINYYRIHGWAPVLKLFIIFFFVPLASAKN